MFRIPWQRSYIRALLSAFALLTVITLYKQLHPDLRSRAPTPKLVLPRVRERAFVVASLAGDDVSWLDVFPAWEKNVYVTNDPSARPSVPVNKGRESMVYLTFIIDNYESFPDIAVFLHSLRYQWHNDDPIYGKLYYTGTLRRIKLTFRPDGIPILRNLRIPHVLSQGYVSLRCVWTLGCPAEVHPHNVDNGDHETEKYFKDAFTVLFPNTTVPEGVGVACCAQFAVTKHKIWERPREEYERYRTWLMETPLDDDTSGRILEYSWHTGFIYPPDKWRNGAADKYKDGDSANVTWDSAYGDPYLQLFCGQFPPLTNQSVDTNGSKSVFFQTGKRDNCYFRLSDHLSYIASANFSIADDTGPAKNWNFSPDARTTSTNRATATAGRVSATVSPASQTSSAESSPSSTHGGPSNTISTSTPTSTAAGGLSTGAKVGLGVGIPVGVLVIAGIAGAVWFFLRRKRSHKYQKGDAAVGTFDGKPELDTSVGIEVPRKSPISKHGSMHDLAERPQQAQYELENRPVQQASHFELDAQSPSVASGGDGLAPSKGQQKPYRDTSRPHSERISGLYD
ncbi:MAG: hypothetical protein M1835_007078 [Candelina submexicana]|nr:MAG: hypothetical protein M1835_007078 [Candelina submexicana]